MDAEEETEEETEDGDSRASSLKRISFRRGLDSSFLGKKSASRLL